MSTPYFSVVTPSFQQGAWIEGCMESVLAQGDGSFEHLVFDNCSTDETAGVLARYPHLQCWREPDRGQAHALNKGFARARGEVICWLNADDQYLPGTWAAVRAAFADPAVHVVYGDAEEVYFDGRPGGVRPARFRRREDLLRWWTKDVDILQPAVFFRRAVLAEVGPLREDLFIVMDTEFWWRVSGRHTFHHLGRPLARQQRQPESKTVRHAVRIYEEKAKVFGPLLAAAEPGRAWHHTLAARRAMGRRFRGLAQSAARTDPGAGRRLLWRALRENPLALADPRTLATLVWILSRPVAHP